MRSIKSAFLILVLIVTMVSATAVSAAPKQSWIPTFKILNVVKNHTVTIRTHNFPAHETFYVMMNHMHTKGKHGIKVTKIYSEGGGSFVCTFEIPWELKDEYQIAIRLESRHSGYYAYNWFYNNTAGSGKHGSIKPGYKGYPTFKILAVQRNKTVTIRTNNLPHKDSFEVLMGPMGTKGKNGYYVGDFNSKKGGSRTLTFDIPHQLKGSKKIAIRIQSNTSSGYFAFNWFWNNTTY